MVGPKGKLELSPRENAGYFAHHLKKLHLGCSWRIDLFVWIMRRHVVELLALADAKDASGT